MKNYFAVADIIAGTFGGNCEVVVHDLAYPENSVVYVANGSVTGRQVGQTFDHLVRQVLLSKQLKDDRVINYMVEGPEGKRIKASSALIRDENSEVIGMLCINCDTTAYELMKAHIDGFLGAEADASAIEEEEITQDVMAVIDALILKIIGARDVKNLTRRKCVELVRFMDEKGIFLVKGAIDKVAALMGVSKVTVYSYLDEAKGKR